MWASNLYMFGEEQILGGVVSPGVFATLGVAPVVGRAIEESDGAAPVVVLSYSLWQRQYGGDPGIIGRTVQLSGAGYTVVGVMPLGFQFPARTFQLWANMGYAMSQVPQQPKNRALRIFQVVGLLRPGVTQAQAQAQLTALAERLGQDLPGHQRRGRADAGAGCGSAWSATRAARCSWRSARSGCLLLIACANVASLTLTRLTAADAGAGGARGARRGALADGAAARDREPADRRVRRRASAWPGAWWGLAALPALIGNRVPRVDEVGLEPAGARRSRSPRSCSAACSSPRCRFCTCRSRRSSRCCGAGGRGGGEPKFGVRLRSALVVAQIGLTVVVLAGSLVLTRSFLRLVNVDAGFSPDRLLAFNLPLDRLSRRPPARIDDVPRACSSRLLRFQA